MNLEKLLRPRSVAVIGASEKPGFGLSTCTNLLRSSRQEHIYFIHPKRESVLGKKCYKRIADLPEQVDMCIILLNKSLVIPALEEAAFRGLLLRRLRPYGERFALVASALCFGLFHGNLNQFFYAFLLGLVLAELALSTGCLWQAVLLHALVNLFSILWGRLGGPVVVTGVLMLAGAMVPFRLIPALLARPDAERGTWRRFLTSPGVLCFGALSLSLALSYLI